MVGQHQTMTSAYFKSPNLEGETPVLLIYCFFMAAAAVCLPFASRWEWEREMFIFRSIGNSRWFAALGDAVWVGNERGESVYVDQVRSNNENCHQHIFCLVLFLILIF
ncbi:hypothetical protein Btru_047205 [Bulinus truncatus]|nr:hypothetical protein Btru_047205 [Bulinus truncatus]